MNYEDVQQPILMGLVGMLKATEDGPQAVGTSTAATGRLTQCMRVLGC